MKAKAFKDMFTLPRAKMMALQMEKRSLLCPTCMVHFPFQCNLYRWCYEVETACDCDAVKHLAEGRLITKDDPHLKKWAGMRACHQVDAEENLAMMEGMIYNVSHGVD